MDPETVKKNEEILKKKKAALEAEAKAKAKEAADKAPAGKGKKDAKKGKKKWCYTLIISHQQNTNKSTIIKSYLHSYQHSQNHKSMLPIWVAKSSFSPADISSSSSNYF